MKINVQMKSGEFERLTKIRNDWYVQWNSSEPDEDDNIVVSRALVSREYPTDEEVLEVIKAETINSIKTYSNIVNKFNFGGNEYWVNKEDRIILATETIPAAELLGKDTISLPLGDLVLELPLEMAKSLLAAIQAYAVECYDVTNKKISEVLNATSIEEVENIKVTSGYPEVLNLSL